MKLQRLLVLTVMLVLGLSSVASGIRCCLPSPLSDALPRCQVITFADEVLETAVREAIGKPSGTFWNRDVASMVSFSAGRRNIQSLEGIEQLTNLRSLHLHYNEIVDISPLTRMTNLTELRLDGNPGCQAPPSKLC